MQNPAHSNFNSSRTCIRILQKMLSSCPLDNSAVLPKWDFRKPCRGARAPRALRNCLEGVASVPECSPHGRAGSRGLPETPRGSRLLRTPPDSFESQGHPLGFPGFFGGAGRGPPPSTPNQKKGRQQFSCSVRSCFEKIHSPHGEVFFIRICSSHLYVYKCVFLSWPRPKPNPLTKKKHF